MKQIKRIRDVAQHAGVSAGTVSKILNGTHEVDRIPDATKERVHAACRELNYRPNFLGRSLATGRVHAIGSLLIFKSDFTGVAFFYTPLLAGLVSATFQRNNHLVSIGSDELGSGTVDNAVDALRQRRIDGLAVANFVTQFDSFEPFETLRAPVVVLGRLDDTSLPVVSVDEEGGVASAVQYLKDLGHKRLLFLGKSNRQHFHVALRQEAFERETKRLRLKSHTLLVSSEEGELISQQVNLASLKANILAESSLFFGSCAPTGVICYNEQVAFALLAALREMNMRVPDDISVVSFDDVQSEIADPPLTSISHQLFEMGKVAVELIEEMVGDDEAWERLRDARRFLPAELVVRGSTGAPPTR